MRSFLTTHHIDVRLTCNSGHPARDSAHSLEWRRWSVSLLVVILGLTAGACPPSNLPGLVLQPEKYCATSMVKIKWDNAIVGTTEISADPMIFATFKVQKQSDTLQEPIDISKLSAPYLVKIIMDVKPGDPNSRLTQDIQILPSGTTDSMPIMFSADCSSGDPPKWRSATEAPDKWDPAIKIKGVRNTSGRNITLSHNGQSATLSTNQLATLFNTQSPSGTWTATTTLKTTPDPTGGEYFACKDVPGTTGLPQAYIRRDPPDLSVEVSYGC